MDVTADRPSPRAARGRLRGAWTAAHTPVDGVPRWARIAAYAVPLTVLPSSVGRIAVVFLDEASAAKAGDARLWLPIKAYVVVLSVLSELLAFTAVGLVAAWGEVVPRRVPLLRGRRVPAPAVAIPAALGAVALTVLWTAAAVGVIAGVTLTGDPLPPDFPSAAGGWEAAVFSLAYAPLLLWGPLLGAATVAYWARRRGGARR
ncbi:hypothetical protein ACFO4E_17410 [Nocardiopsis mangrovi]|uniref:Integral membrane protein n=1 Tax=Nocardiopsis mangrovi TaxID=1179818 RepID=A0ABV9DY11_9ACTN